MTVQTSNTRVVFDGDGQTVRFPFGFRILENEHIDVFLTNPTGSAVQGINPNQVRKLQASEFSVTINEPQPGMGEPGVQETPGGTVRLDGFGAPATGLKVSVERATPLTQLTDYVPNDPFPADTHERALDKLTVIVQELKREVNDTLVSAPPGENPNCPPLPIASERANKFLKFNSAGCPTIATLDEDGNIVAPEVLSDLDNVAASNASDRQVISLNATTGDWTPEDNVFSINDIHGDITISTNSDGDIVINNGEGDTTTINGDDIGDGSTITTTFTAAEPGSRGDFVALRSNEQIELLASTTVSGGASSTTDIVGNNASAHDAVYIPEEDVHFLLYENGSDSTKLAGRLVEVNNADGTIANIGSEFTVHNFSNSVDIRETGAIWDSINKRIVVITSDVDEEANSGNAELAGKVIELDFANLGATTVGSLKTIIANTDMDENKPGLGFHEGEGSVVIGFQDQNNNINGNFHGVVFVAVQVDPNNNNFSSIGSGIAEGSGDDNVRTCRFFPYTESNDTLAVTTLGSDDVIRAFALSVSNTSLSTGNLIDVVTGDAIGAFGIAYDPNSGLASVAYSMDETQDGTVDIRGAVVGINGDQVTLEDDRVLLADASETPTDMDEVQMFWSASLNKWVFGWPNTAAASVGDSDAVIWSGTIDATAPKLTLDSGPKAGQSTSITDTEGDVNTNAPVGWSYDEKAGVFAAWYQDDDKDSLNVSLGSPPQTATNLGRWVGNADTDFQAGDDVPVNLRGSDTFVNTSSSLTPGTTYFLNPDGSLGSSSGDFRAGLATSTDTLLTAGVDFRDEGGTDDGGTSSTSSASAEELIEGREISSATNTIDVTLPPDFVKYRIDLLEVQSDSADTDNDNLLVRFSNDGGSSFISSSNYKWLSSITTFTSGQFQNGNTGATAGRHAPPPPNTSGLANHYTFWVLGARNPDTYSTVKSEEISTGGGGTGYTEGHDVLEKAEDHDALRFKVENSVNITRAIVRVVGTK